MRLFAFALYCSFPLAVAACSSTNDTSPEAPVHAAAPDAGAPASPEAGAVSDAATPPDAGATTDGAGATTCSGQPGTLHDQPFASGGETRHYWLNVPPSYRCANAAPLLVDFHGTGYGTATDAVEESWATPDLTSASNDLGFIVVRPRSRGKPDGTGNLIYQWDINPGDIALNKAFAQALVADLMGRYHVDPARIYASGFSNGPGMAAQFLGDEPSLFHGYGLVSGGMNQPPTRSVPFGADAPRIYTMVGFRDYMQISRDSLETFLAAHAYPGDKRFDREADTGHEVYGWHFREAFAWMDAGKRPPAGTLAAPWTEESTGTTESLVETTTNPAGGVVAVGAKGGIYARNASGAWSSIAALPAIAPLSDVCFTPSGAGYAVGHGHFATAVDGTTWAQAADIPEFAANPQFGYTYATSIACSSGRVTAGGVWSAATSIDGGKNWTVANVTQADGASAFATAIRSSPTGWLGVGYFWASRSSDGATFSDTTPSQTTQWWNDAALDGVHGLIVGEAGAIQLTDDGGAHWSAVSAPSHEDLYAVALRGKRAAAVGQHGCVIVSNDGGATWTDRSTGLDAFMGSARLLDDATLLVAGGGGKVLRLALP